MMIKAVTFSVFSLLLLNSCGYSLSYSDGNIIQYPTKDISIEATEYGKYQYQGKTYQITTEKLKVNDPDNKWTTPEFDLTSFTGAVIQNELNNKKLKQADTSADILVSYGFDVDMSAIKIKLFGDSDGNYVFNVPKGTLSIVITDQKNDNILWMAWAKAKFQKRERDIAMKRLEYAINKMFNKLPD